MSFPIDVQSYSGHEANEHSRQFMLDDEIYEIAAVLDQWCEPSAMYFKVQSTEGKTYLLRYDEHTEEWTLQSGFDGDELPDVSVSGGCCSLPPRSASAFAFLISCSGCNLYRILQQTDE